MTQVARHHDDMSTASEVKRLAHGTAKVGQSLLVNDDETAQSLLQTVRHTQTFWLRPIANNDQELMNVRSAIAQNDINGLNQRCCFSHDWKNHAYRSEHLRLG
jgi:hypothetical protein